jgi:hypothetical protein
VTDERRREFDRQVNNLLSKGYPKLAGMDEDVFLEHITPLKGRLHELPTADKEMHIPFVVVVTGEMVNSEDAMCVVELGGKQGFVNLDPVQPKSFGPIDRSELPSSVAYLIADVDTGGATLNVTPEEALKTIRVQNRSPLTIDEGIALVTHFPEVLKTRNCFSILGSRCGDRRVPAIWISRGRPRLGWCWAGNPHTWLGSASCGSRIGRVLEVETHEGLGQISTTDDLEVLSGPLL